MNSRTEQMLKDSPSPVIYSILILLFAAGAITLHSAILALVTGILIGSYFGNYQGRSAVINAWIYELNAEYRQRRQERLGKRGELNG